jgi:hypothetical protein
MANTWNSKSTTDSTSSKASTLFGLDEDDRNNILVYRYRQGKKALEVSSQHSLCKELDSGKSEAALWEVFVRVANGSRLLQIQTFHSCALPRRRSQEATVG